MFKHRECASTGAVVAKAILIKHDHMHSFFCLLSKSNGRKTKLLRFFRAFLQDAKI